MNCVLCGGATFSVVSHKLRHDVPRRVVRCDGCDLVSLEDPQDEVMDYDKEYGEKHGPVIGRKSDPSELFQVYLPFMAERIQRLRHLLTPEARVLEIGCSTGFFLHSIKPLVGSVRGVELSPERGAYARSRGLDIHIGRVEEAGLEPHSFDAIFLFQVFEHVTAPLAFLEQCRGLLASGGVVYLEVPNVDDALLTVFGISGYRDFYWRAPHAYYYGPSTLGAMLAKGGFEGRVGFSQEYSLFNHTNWLLHGTPQPSVTLARGVPFWPPSPGSDAAADRIVKWLERADNEYREMIEELGVAQNLTYEGSVAGTSP